MEHTEDCNGQDQEEINVKKLKMCKPCGFKNTGDDNRRLTWISPRLDADAYKKLTEVN